MSEERLRGIMIHEVMRMCYEEGIEVGEQRAIKAIKEIINGELKTKGSESGEGTGEEAE